MYTERNCAINNMRTFFTCFEGKQNILILGVFWHLLNGTFSIFRNIYKTLK